MKRDEIVKDRCRLVLERARLRSEDFRQRASMRVAEFFRDQPGHASDICFAVIGSVGRDEALEQSDLDLMPIAATPEALACYMPFDKDLRSFLRSSLNCKVSEGEDLTKPTSIDDITNPEFIGGTKDESSWLTKRVLLLTESKMLDYGLEIKPFRNKILAAYGGQERTSGRHILTLCNDIARYYKTLCIEYKAKIDSEDKDWSSRNMKLRHSRKLWFFSNIISISAQAARYPKGDDLFQTALLDTFEKTPIERLCEFLIQEQSLSLAKMLESYALFLDFMSNKDNRSALSRVPHDARYDLRPDNPFPALKFNSDVLHNEILTILEELGPAHRARIVSWFLL